MAQPSRMATIVAATDFSGTAEGATDWGAQLARTHGARLVLVHALLPAITPTAAPEFVPLPVEIYEEERRAVKEALEKRAAALRQTGCTVETQLEIGPAVSTILDATLRCKADLLVVGTRGLTGFKRILMGSTAARLVRDASCPVLTVHPEATRHRPVHRILVPTDFSQDAARALEAAGRILGPVTDHARVTLLHVYRTTQDIVTPWPAPVLVEASRDVETEARKLLDETAAPLRELGIEVVVQARAGYPPEVIDEEARRIAADVIAMGTHGRSGLKRLFLGSTAERVLPAAPCPVLTVREGDGAEATRPSA
jgi:nucleotide-binding universal stress UspA family protein